MSVFSCAFWPFGHLLLRSISSCVVPIFLYWVVFLLLIWKSFYIFWIKVNWWWYASQISSSTLCRTCSWWCLLLAKIFTSAHLCIFSFIVTVFIFFFYVCLKKSFWLQDHSYFILGSLLKSLLFYSSQLALSSMWSLFCVWCARSRFTCFYIVTQWSSYHLLKVLSFPLTALQEILNHTASFHRLVELFLDPKQFNGLFFFPCYSTLADFL